MPEKLLWNVVQVSASIGIILVLLLLVRSVLMKRYHAGAVCLIWAVLALRLVIPLQMTVPHASVTISPPARISHNVFVQISQEGFATRQNRWQDGQELEQKQPNLQITFRIGEIIFLVWGMGVLGMAGVQFHAYQQFRRAILHSGHHINNSDIQNLMQSICDSMSIKHSIPLIKTHLVNGPMLMGFLCPILLLPTGHIQKVQIEFILKHELMHYKRKDLWLKLLLCVVRCMHWFNPMVHLMTGAACEDIELACDSAVVKNMDAAQRKLYGACILNSAASQLASQALTTCFTSGKECLKVRIKELFNKRVKKRGIAMLLSVFIVTLIVGGCFAIRQDHTGGVADPNKISGADQLSLQLTDLAEQWGTAMCERDANTLLNLFVDLTPHKREDLLIHLLGVDTPMDDDLNSATPWIIGYSVIGIDPDARTATLVYSWKAPGLAEWRSAMRLTFTKDNAPVVRSIEQPVPKADMGMVDTLEKFLMLYGNDLGMPVTNVTYEGVYNPQSTAEGLLHLKGGSWIASEAYYAQKKRTGNTLTYQFSDGQQLNLVVMGDYIQDWYLADHSNTRTPVDLANQWARGLNYKNAAFRYPILSNEEQKKFVEAQIADTGYGEGEWSWKIGGSSPSVTAWSVVSATDKKALLVYVSKDSTPMEYRFAEQITFARDEHGRLTVTGSDQGYGYIPFSFSVVPEGYQKMSYAQRFDLFYGHGLPLPGFTQEWILEFTRPEFADREIVQALQDPFQAVRYLFGFDDAAYGHFRVTDYYSDDRDTRVEDTVQITVCFRDGGAVNIQMKKADNTNFWLPESWQLNEEADITVK